MNYGLWFSPLCCKRQQFEMSRWSFTRQMSSDRLRPQSPSVAGEDIEDVRAVEKLANARAGVRDPELTVRGRGHVEQMNELPDAAGVQIRHGREIQLDSPNAAAQDGVHGALEFEVEREAQRSADVQDRDAERTFLSK
jgi:hypothetical protein